MDKEKLKDLVNKISTTQSFRPLAVEKDYYLSLLLSDVNSQLSDKIIFKGGTLLNKAYLNYHRLSEDLDFAYDGVLTSRPMRSRAIDPIIEKMPEFLKNHGFTSENPRGEGFNNSIQYVFKAQYSSVISNKNEEIKIEISLREPLVVPPVKTTIKHFFQDPITGKDIIPQGKVLSLSYKEAVAEKLKAAITRKDVAIRDYYDLWHIDERGFDFKDPQFIQIFKRKLAIEKYRAEYWNTFGLNNEKIAALNEQVQNQLQPMIRTNEEYDLNKTFTRFNKIFSNKKLQPIHELEQD